MSEIPWVSMTSNLINCFLDNIGTFLMKCRKETIRTGRLARTMLNRPRQSASPDGIFPALRQEDADIVQEMIMRLIKASFAYGYI